MIMKSQEPFLEPIARYLRFNKGITQITAKKPIVIVDLGCGPYKPFYFYAKNHGVKIKKYIGIDPLLSNKFFESTDKNNRVSLLRNSLEKKIPLPSSSVDYVVSFAALEHFNHPQDILNDAIRILKRHGKIILTTPTKIAKPLLEFLEKIGLVSSREIHEHKHYFDKKSLKGLISVKNVKIRHIYFEAGLNNLLVIEKTRMT